MISDYSTTELLNKIKRRQAVVSVVGIGYVGLPLAVAFAEAGFKVVGVDADATRVEALNRGESYIADVTSETLTRLTSNGAKPPENSEHSLAALKQQGRLSATTDYAAVGDIDVVIVCVPTSKACRPLR